MCVHTDVNGNELSLINTLGSGILPPPDKVCYDGDEEVVRALKMDQGICDMQQALFSENLPVGLKEQFASQIIQQVAFVHDENVAHNDLKPENVIFKRRGSRYTAHLIDWGSAGLLNGEEAFAPKTVSISAPEDIYTYTVVGNGWCKYKAKPTKEADMWGLGIMLFMLYTNCVHPYILCDDEDQLERV